MTEPRKVRGLARYPTIRWIVVGASVVGALWLLNGIFEQRGPVFDLAVRGLESAGLLDPVPINPTPEVKP